MTNFIPIFPLSIVVFPGETVNLHIFEPRYKQLIRECRDEKKPFGIPVVLDNKLQEMGTLVNIAEVVQEYENGEMDIRVKGSKVFRSLEVIRAVPDKLFSGAIVNYPHNADQGKDELMSAILKAMKEMHRLLNINKDFKKPVTELNSYDIAHHVGLSIEEEYEFLGLLVELQRQEYLKRHFRRILPVLMQIEQLKKKIKLNGHFKNLESLDLAIDYPDTPEE